MDREQIKLLKFALSLTQDWTDDFITTVAKISDLSERTVREWYLDELEEDKTLPRSKSKRNLDASVLKSVCQDQDNENKRDHLRRKRLRQASPEKAAAQQNCDKNSSSESVENERAKQSKRLILLYIDESEYDATLQRRLKPFIMYEGIH